MKPTIYSVNFKIFLDILILSLILLLISVMGGIGFDFAVGSRMVSLHSLKNVLIVTIFIWFIRKAIDKEKETIINKTSLNVSVLFYLITFIIAAIYSSQPRVSFLYLRDIILYIGMTYLLINNINNKNKLEAILFILIIAVIFTISYGVYKHSKTQLYWGDDNYYSFVGHAEFGSVIVFTIPILVGLFLNYRKKITASLFFVIGLIVLATGLMISYSRGSWIGFIAILIVSFFLYNGLLKNWKLCLVPVFFVIMFLVLPVTVKSRAISMVNFSQDIGVNERFFIWRSSIDMIKDHPAFGVGPGTFDIIYPKYDMLKDIKCYDKVWHAHNIFFQIASENGMIGLVSFLTIIIISFQKYFELKNKIKDIKLKNILDGVIISLIGYIVCSQTSVFFTYHNKNEKVSMFLWFDIALIFIIERISKEEVSG